MNNRENFLFYYLGFNLKEIWYRAHISFKRCMKRLNPQIQIRLVKGGKEKEEEEEKKMVVTGSQIKVTVVALAWPSELQQGNWKQWRSLI